MQENAGGTELRSEPVPFSSTDKPVPPVRADLEIHSLQSDGRRLLLFQDSLGFIPKNFALAAETAPLLSLFNGRSTVRDIIRKLNHQLNEKELIRFIRLLDQNSLLDSEYLGYNREASEIAFEKRKVRTPLLDSRSDQQSIRLITERLQSVKYMDRFDRNRRYKALFAPHIDLSLGLEQYLEAFGAIAHLRPKRVVILATSHYAGLYGDTYRGFPFVGSSKEFQVNGRSYPADQTALHQLLSNSPGNGFTLMDRAHRMEHSIEIHLICLAAIWKHSFSIVPILTGSLDELFYHQSGDITNKTALFTRQLSEFDTLDTFFLISGDLSHTGRKFGDPYSARQNRRKSEQRDQNFLDYASSGDPNKLLNEVASDYDATHICGFPPLYTYLNIFPNQRGEILNYHWWDEQERESAVSFGSILYS